MIGRQLITKKSYKLKDNYSVYVSLFYDPNEPHYSYVLSHPCFSKGFTDKLDALIELERIIETKGSK